MITCPNDKNLQLDIKRLNSRYENPEQLKARPNTTRNPTHEFDFQYQKATPSASRGSNSDDSNLVDKLSRGREGSKDKYSNLNLVDYGITKQPGTVIRDMEGPKTRLKTTERNILREQAGLTRQYDIIANPALLSANEALGRTRELFSPVNKETKLKHEMVDIKDLRLKGKIIKPLDHKLYYNTGVALPIDIYQKIEKRFGLKIQDESALEKPTEHKFYNYTSKPSTATNKNAKAITFDVNPIETTSSAKSNRKKTGSPGVCGKTKEVSSAIDWKMFCAKLKSLEALVHTFVKVIKQSKDPHEVIRDYINFIQEAKFNDFSSVVAAAHRETVTESFIIERWAVFAIFYNYLDYSIKIKHKFVVRAAVSIYKNLLFYLKLIHDQLKSLEESEKSKLFLSVLENRVLPQNADFFGLCLDPRDLISAINESNKEIQDFLLSVAVDASSKISKGIMKLTTAKLDSGIDSSIDLLLDTFCDFFVKKGVVNTESHQAQNSPKHAVKAPFIKKPIDDSRDYCLVLDLDETLVHYSLTDAKKQVLLRPHVHRFLEEMGKHFEIVVFTAARQDYADWVIDRLDKGNNVSYRLYRQHTSNQGNVNIKDLAKIGRDLKKTIIVDNIAENFQLQPGNGIFVKTWFKDPADTVLLKLIPLLRGWFNRYRSQTTN